MFFREEGKGMAHCVVPCLGPVTATVEIRR